MTEINGTFRLTTRDDGYRIASFVQTGGEDDGRCTVIDSNDPKSVEAALAFIATAQWEDEGLE